MDNLVDKLRLDLDEDLSEFDENFDLHLIDEALLLPDDILDDLLTPEFISDDHMSDIPIFCEKPDPSTNLVESLSHNIPTNPQEWLVKDKISRRRRPPRLYEFLILLLQKPHYSSYASYKDKSLGIFVVHQPEKVADLWQQIKNRQSQQNMTYDKFARAIRWYYKDDIMTKTNARYTFQFSQKTLERITTDENNNIVIKLPM